MSHRFDHSHTQNRLFVSIETYLAFFFVAFFLVPFFFVAFFLAILGLHKRNTHIQLRHHRRLYTFFEPDAHALAYARFFHRDPIQYVGVLHRPLVVRDHDEL